MVANNKFLWTSGDITITDSYDPLTPEEIQYGNELLDRVEAQLKSNNPSENECITVPANKTFTRVKIHPKRKLIGCSNDSYIFKRQGMYFKRRMQTIHE